LLAAVVALSPVALVATATPAAAQVNVNVNIGFDYFYDELSPYGDWNYHPRWGDVWRPTRIGSDFRPYYRGYWANTEYGWTWESQDPWGDIPYHYGRWVYDPYDGWLWVPGYTWAPAWVVWRGGGNNIGWFPMPPDDQFLAGYDVYRDDWNWDRGYFGYSDWYGPSIATGLLAAWTFVALDRFADRDYYRYAYQRPQVVNIINNTTNVTNYVTVNNRIVNRSVDITRVERAANRRIERVEARNIVRTPITTVETGRQVQVRERERHGGDIRAAARERVRAIPQNEVRVPVRERRSVQFQRDQKQQQAQQPDAQKQQPGAGGRLERDQQRDTDRQQRAQTQQQEREAAQRAQAEQRERNAAQQGEQQQRERGAVLQQQRERDAAEQQNRARAEQAERQQRERGAALQQQRERDAAEQQNRARAEQQDRARADQAERQRRSQIEQQDRARVQAEQQNRARAEQAQRQAEQQNRARAEQQQRQAQAEQQNRARAQQAERQQQQQAAAQERQQKQRAKQQQKQDEEEKQRRGPN
jgi:hypothetical protein